MRFEVIEDAGHFTWKDAPDRYRPLLAGFVAAAAEHGAARAMITRAGTG